MKMRKVLVTSAAVLLFLIPMAASAMPIGTIGNSIGTIGLELDVTPGITGGGYYTDYQALVTPGGNWVELFCVEDQPAAIDTSVPYDLFKLSDIETNVQAAWIAETYWNSDNATKGQAQLAIWDLLDTISGKPDISSPYAMANDILNYVTNPGISLEDYTSNWVLASNLRQQDYLMRAAPVPEPATMLLLGTGLIGMAGLGRKKFLK